MKVSKFSYSLWVESLRVSKTPTEVEKGRTPSRSRRVVEVPLGGTVPSSLAEGGQSFGSGGYGGYVVWSSPSGQCPIEGEVSDESSSFISARGVKSPRFVRPGVVFHFEEDDLRPDPIADVIYVCQEQAFEVRVIGLSGAEDNKTIIVRAVDACAAIRARYPHKSPTPTSNGGATTAVPTDSVCWDSASYPYIEASPVRG